MNEFSELLNEPERQPNIAQSNWADVGKWLFYFTSLPSESTTASSSFLVIQWLNRRLSKSEVPLEQTEFSNFIRNSETGSLLSKVDWLRHDLPSKPLDYLQPPETRWVQNLRNPAYHLRQPIPIVIERGDGAVTATYDDVELNCTGKSMIESMSELCAKIVSRYEELRKSAAKSQEFTFLKRIIEEVEPPAWQELKHLYKVKLEEIPYVQAGYINISAPEYADVILVLSEYSVDKIEQLAEIDLELNLKFRPMYFFVKYKSTNDSLELKDFERFH